MTIVFSLFRNRSLLAFAAFTAMLASQPLRAQCNFRNLVMSGTYAMVGTGTIVGVGPIATLGSVTYDGQGNGSVTYTVTVNGTVSKAVPATGAYTVNSDCTGSKTFGSGPSAQHFNFVITPDGNKITWIVTDPGVVMIGTAERLFR
jgi:hypothetical protein